MVIVFCIDLRNWKLDSWSGMVSCNDAFTAHPSGLTAARVFDVFLSESYFYALLLKASPDKLLTTQSVVHTGQFCPHLAIWDRFHNCILKDLFCSKIKNIVNIWTHFFFYTKRQRQKKLHSVYTAHFAFSKQLSRLQQQVLFCQSEQCFRCVPIYVLVHCSVLFYSVFTLKNSKKRTCNLSV